MLCKQEMNSKLSASVKQKSYCIQVASYQRYWILVENTTHIAAEGCHALDWNASNCGGIVVEISGERSENGNDSE